MTLERIDEMIRACEENNVMLAGVFPRRFHQSTLEFKKAIDSGRLGRVTLADAYIKWYRTQEYYDSGAWRGTWKLDGGGALMNQSIHTIDLLYHLAGEVDTVCALADLAMHERIEVEDNAAAVVRFKNGALGVIEGSTSCFSNTGHPAEVQICGSGGSIFMKDDAFTVWDFKEPGPEDQAIRERFKSRKGVGAGAADPKAISYVGHQLNFEDFIEALEQGRKPAVDGYEGRKSVEIILAVYASALDKGRPVKLPLKATPDRKSFRPKIRNGFLNKGDAMTSRDRLLTALDHREPDRVPFDLGSTQITGIHKIAYEKVRSALDLPRVEPRICDAIQGLALPDDDFVERFKIDTRGLFALNSHNWKVEVKDAGENWAYRDEWGITHHKPKEGGLYFSVVKVPLGRSGLTPTDIENHPWPRVGDPERMAGLKDLARKYREAGLAVVVKDGFAGIFEFAQRIVGMENLLLMMFRKDKAAEALFDKLLELKLSFWEIILGELGELVDVVTYADDYGTQTSQLISPDMFRTQIKPRVAALLQAQKKLAPRAKRFFHSDGNVRPLLPDFIEMGVDILNPIQFTATGMDLAALKKDFGQDIVLWGGGVDTQGVLPQGSPQEVRDQVKRNLDILAPGGGYVFNTIHNIQADVPGGKHHGHVGDPAGMRGLLGAPARSHKTRRPPLTRGGFLIKRPFVSSVSAFKLE